MKRLVALKKRILSSSVSVILAVAIVLSTFSGMFILAGVLPSIWSGETATSFAKGSGTKDDPFIVSNGEELALAVSSTGRDGSGNQYYYSMSSDIVLNDVTNAAWKDDASNHEWAFVQKDATSASKAFSGVFYGNGYKVYGLFIKESFAAPSDNKPDESYAAGLFPTATSGAVISGVGLEDSYIALTNNHATSGYSRAGNVGAIIGYVYADFDAPVKLDRCYSSESVHLTGAFCGLVGGISNSRKNDGTTALRMDSCYGISTATVFFDWSDWAGNRFMMLSSLKSNNLTANYCYTTGGYGFYDLISETGASNYTPNWIPNNTVFTKVSADAMKGDGALSASGMALLGDSGNYVTTATYPVLKIFADREVISDKDIWDGSKVAPKKGTGSETDPYLIETPEELAYVVYNKGGVGKFYKLANDIYLNDITKIDWSTGAVAPGYTVNSWVGSRDGFNGTIDGDGHTVYGMYYKSTSTKAWGYNGVGLVGKILSGEVTIKRLGVDNAYLEHKNAASAFIGWLQNGATATIDMCFAGENVTLNSWETGAFIGQGNGADFRFHISNSFSRASMTSSHRYGLHGEFYGGGLKESSVSNCFNANGPIYSASTSATIANCYATVGSVGTVITAANMQGEDALTSANKMPALGNKFLATQGYPEINFEGKVIIPTPDYVWDGTTAAPSEGDGSEETPYIIKTAEEFVHVMRSGGKGKHYKLANSIYLNDVNKVNWETGEGIDGYSPRSWGSVPENWNGTIDGAGFTVYGLYNKGGNSFSWGWSGAGLIPKLKGDSANVTFKNLGLDNCYMVHENAAGGFVGYHEKGNLTLNKCFVGQNAYFKGYSAGTLFGMAPGGVYNITNCYSLGTSERGADKADSLYGLHGQVYGGNAASTLTNCYNANGPVTTGGEAGTFKNNYATEGTKGTILTKDNMQGADALTNPDKMPKLGRFFKATATYPVIDFDAVEDTTPDYVWDGSTVAPTKGSGTLDDPYLIENAENLAAVIKSGGKKGANYKLTADIYINDITKIDWATGEVADDYTLRKWGVGWPDTFSGIIDGDGHVVYGLYYRSDSTMAWGFNGAGLIGKIVSGDVVLIKNLGVDCAFVKHHNAASAFIGYNNGGATASIDKCYVGEMVTLSGYETGAFIGQAPGGSFSLTNCYSLATLVKGPGNDSVYGLYGQAYGEGSTNSSVMHCFNGNGPISTQKVGSMKNNYATVEGGGATVLTADNMKGTDVFENIAKMSVLNRTKAFVPTDSFPILKVFSSDPSTGGGTQGEIWDGLVINAFAQGSGTKTDPYMISSGSELAFAVGTRSGLYFKLAKDIYLNDVSSNGWYLGDELNEWFTGKSFSGHIDGDGHCVYGIWYPSGNNYKYAGLLPQMSSGSVKNLGIRYSYITAKNFAAGFTAYVEGWSGNEVTFENCFVDDTVRIGFTGTETWNDASYGAGGFVAYLYGYDKEAAAAGEKVARTVSFNNCYSKATIEGTSVSRMNGMIGTIWLSNYSIKNCYSLGYPVVFASGNTMAFDIHNHQTGIDATDYSDVFANNYSDVGNESMSKVYKIVPAIADWHGEKAKKSLKGFDFANVWETVGKGSPKLKIFDDISGEDISMPDPTGTFASGKGTKNDPYIIKTAKHLRNMVEMKITAGKYFVIANDIYVNDTTNKNWKKSAAKWIDGKDLPVFGGHLDGGGHKVYGLFVANTAQTGSDLSTSATGLIPRAGVGASVKNVHVRDSYIAGTGYAGAIIGYTNGSSKGKYISVIGCSADETVSVQGQTAGGIIGGGPTGIRLYYCYFTGKLSATSEGRCNALMGDIWNSDCQVVECYSVGYESYRGAPQNIIKVYGTEEDTKVTVLTKAQMIGANAKKNMDLSFDTYWYTANGKTPQLKVVDENNLGYTFKDEGKKGRVWSGKIATKFAGGSGTEEDPYLIETPEQLAYMFYRGAGSYSYKLIADIKLNDTSKADWEKTANTWFSGRNYSFSGHFDGNGHVVTGLYAESTDAIVALFPYVYYNAIIENLGIDDSSIVNPSSDGYKQSYSGALVGYIESWQSDANNYKHPPIIRKCFVGDGVYVEGFFAGGLVAGCAKSAVFEDCYVTCELTGSSMSGAFIATAWNSDIPIEVTNCYAATVNGDNFISNGASKAAVYTNVYHDGTRGGAPDTMNILSMFFMQGTRAKEYLKGFDFNKVWRLVEGGTPVLRVFGNAAQYSCTREPNKVEISFATNGGEPIEPFLGFGYTDIEKEIPTPVRYGYRFLGWYYTPNFAVEFDLTKYPPNDMILYAKWEEIGFEYGFEGDLDTEYDVLGNMEHYRPGVMGYNPKNVKAGLKALHILAENEKDPLFLVNYRFPLEVGKEYEVTFWVMTATEDKVDVDFLYAEHPQADSPVIGYEKIVEGAGGTPGVWKQYKATITAAAPYLLVRTSKGVEVYYDEFQLVPTDKEGDLSSVITFAPENVQTEPDKNGGNATLVIILSIVGGVILLAAVATVTVVFIKKRKKA